MMTTRELPVPEWPKLAEVNASLGPLAGALPPEHTRILVVEDEGQIVGCWALMSILHVEGLWIAPSHRHGPSVGRHLLATMREWLRESRIAAVVSTATEPHIEQYLSRLGASPLPGQSYIWSMEES